jgi:AcrR family transcriptional regulator
MEPTGARTGARQRLLEVAGRLFYAEGIHAVGIDRIIAEAGVAKATLYAHFSGKEELVAAYLGERSDRWASDVAARVEPLSPGSPERALAPFDLLAERVTVPGYRGCPFINAAAEFPPPGLVADRIADHRRRVRGTFEALAAEAGGAPGSAAAELVVLYDGAMTAAHLDADPSAVTGARALAASVVAGLHAPGSTTG